MPLALTVVLNAASESLVSAPMKVAVQVAVPRFSRRRMLKSSTRPSLETRSETAWLWLVVPFQ